MSQAFPGGAFEYYVSLGMLRGFDLVAKHFDVDVHAVTDVATRERWSERLLSIEREAQERVDAKLVDSVEQMRLRHKKMLQAIAGRAVKALQEHPLKSGFDGVRAAAIVIRLERLLADESGQRDVAILGAMISRDLDGDGAVDEELRQVLLFGRQRRQRYQHRPRRTGR